MPNTTIHAVTLEHDGWTYLAFWGGSPETPERTPEGYESDAYALGKLIPARRPVCPVRCYEGARS